MGADHRTGAVERVWADVRDQPREALTHKLPPTDLQTLLLDVARSRAGAVTPARLMRRWRTDRFVQPASADPRATARLEASLWALLPDRFTGIDLSPVTPLGTCSAMSTVSQNQILPTVRGTEVVSDQTNVLALEAARRRMDDASGDRGDLAACHRVLRTQPVDGPGLFAHFRLFALVSSARDRGSARTEADLLTSHLDHWGRALGSVLPHTRVRLRFTSFDAPVLTERFRDTVLPALDGLPRNVTVAEDPVRTRSRGYYSGCALGIDAGDDLGDVGDGGLTDWTAQLMSDGKERCLTSCVAVERLAALV